MKFNSMIFLLFMIFLSVSAAIKADTTIEVFCPDRLTIENGFAVGNGKNILRTPGQNPRTEAFKKYSSESKYFGNIDGVKREPIFANYYPDTGTVTCVYQDSKGQDVKLERTNENLKSLTQEMKTNSKIILLREEQSF